MLDRRQFRRVLAGLVAVGCCAVTAAQDARPERRGGTIVGLVSARDKNWIEVRAEGEEKPRRYVPHWVGGAPRDGGGPDKKMVEAIARVKVGSRVRIRWEFEERPRVVQIEVLRAPAKER